MGEANPLIDYARWHKESLSQCILFFRIKTPSFRLGQLVERTELWTLEPKERQRSPFLIKRNIQLLQWHVLFFKAPLVRGFLTNEWWLKLSAPMTLEIGLLNKDNSGLLSSYPSPIALPFNKMMGFLSQPERLVVIPYLPWLYLRKLA